MVDDYSKLGCDWTMIAARYLDVIVFDAFTAMVGLVASTVQDAIAPRWNSTLFLGIHSTRLL